MKNSTVLKEGLFVALLIGAILFFASVVVVSYAGASSIENREDRWIAQPHDFSVTEQMENISAEDKYHLKKVAEAIVNYRKAILKSGKAKSSVMAVFWKIKAADSLGANIQAHYDAIKHLLKMSGDELKLLATPKNISALADKSDEKLARKMQMEKILIAIELSLG